MVANWLVKTFQQPLAPAFYVMVYGVIGLLLMWPMSETNTRPLDR
jgi:hypothetical protein